MSFGGPNTQYVLVKPPTKGSFPLDHDGECAGLVRDYLECIRSVGRANRAAGLDDPARALSDQTVCRAVMRAYFECRMQRGLMAREEWSALGLGGQDRGLG